MSTSMSMSMSMCKSKSISMRISVRAAQHRLLLGFIRLVICMVDFYSMSFTCSCSNMSCLAANFSHVLVMDKFTKEN